MPAKTVKIIRPDGLSVSTHDSSSEHPRKIGYIPALLVGLDLGSAPAGKPLLDAIEYLRIVHVGGKRSGPPPTAFARKSWAGQLKTADGTLDLIGYRLCVLDGLRRAIRRRDVFPIHSLRYADPRKGLLSGAAWEAARPAVCRTIGVSASADEELGRLSARLELAFRETAERVPANPAGDDREYGRRFGPFCCSA